MAAQQLLLFAAESVNTTPLHRLDLYTTLPPYYILRTATYSRTHVNHPIPGAAALPELGRSASSIATLAPPSTKPSFSACWYLGTPLLQFSSFFDIYVVLVRSQSRHSFLSPVHAPSDLTSARSFFVHLIIVALSQAPSWQSLSLPFTRFKLA